jgi:predicted nucleic acid-binding protein
MPASFRGSLPVDSCIVTVVSDSQLDDADRSDAVHALFDQWAQRGEPLHAPALLPVGVMNPLLSGVRRGRWDGQAADTASGFVVTLPISLHDHVADRHRAWELARRYDNHPLNDMLYVALAQCLGEPLITVDDRLCRRLAPLNLISHPADALRFDIPPALDRETYRAEQALVHPISLYMSPYVSMFTRKVTGGDLGGYAE